MTFVVVDDQPGTVRGLTDHLIVYGESLGAAFDWCGVSFPDDEFIQTRPDGSKRYSGLTPHYDCGSAFEDLKSMGAAPDVLILDVKLTEFGKLEGGEAYAERQNAFLRETREKLPERLRQELDGEGGLKVMAEKAGWFLWAELENLARNGNRSRPSRTLVVTGSGQLDMPSAALHSFIHRSGVAEFYVKNLAPFANAKDFEEFRAELVLSFVCSGRIREDRLLQVRRNLASYTTREELVAAVVEEVGDGWSFAGLWPEHVVNVMNRVDFELNDEGSLDGSKRYTQRWIEVLDQALQARSKAALFFRRRSIGSESMLSRLFHPGSSSEMAWLKAGTPNLEAVQSTLLTARRELINFPNDDFRDIGLKCLTPLLSRLALAATKGAWPAVADAMDAAERDYMTRFGEWGKISRACEALLLQSESPVNLEVAALAKGLTVQIACVDCTGGVPKLRDELLADRIAPMLPFVRAGWGIPSLLEKHGLSRVSELVDAFLNGAVGKYGATKIVLDARAEAMFVTLYVVHNGPRSDDSDEIYLNGEIAKLRARRAGEADGDFTRLVRASEGWLDAALYVGDVWLDLLRPDAVRKSTDEHWRRLRVAYGDQYHTALVLRFWVAPQ